MLTSTLDIIRFALRADPTMTNEDRAMIINVVRSHASPRIADPVRKPEVKIIHIKEAARRLGCTPRTVHNLVRQGLIPKFIFPGRSRNHGIVEKDLEDFIAVRAGSRPSQSIEGRAE